MAGQIVGFDANGNAIAQNQVIIDDINNVEYKIKSVNGESSLDVAGEYTEFEINQENLSQIGFDYDMTEFVIPAAFVGDDGVTYKVTSIAYSTFYNCRNLTSITIPNTVTNIGNGAFWLCTGLTSITIPASVTSIGDYLFKECGSLTSVTFLNDMTIIGTQLFYGCTNLTNITIPYGVTNIGSAFNGCTNLTNISIPNSVINISSYAFSGCTSLTTVYYEGTKEEWNNITIGSNNDPLTNANIVFAYSGSGSGLPEVTTDDNGSFLRVVDGVWVVTNIPVAEDGEY